jgi:hypothetical protein
MEPTSANHRTMPNNQLNIITCDDKQETCMLIDIAISGDRIVIKKETKKFFKYQDLILKIQRSWNPKSKVIPVIIGMTGTISKSLRQYLINITGKHEIKEVQKQPLGTANVLQKGPI